jgi:hypothetical protein
MGWTAPADWAVAESPTAAKINANLRDNMNWLHDEVPTCAVYANDAQTFSNGTWTTLTFDTDNIDNDTMHDPVTDTGRITIGTAGVYMFAGQVAFEAITDTHELGLRFLANGGTVFCALRGASVNRDGTGLSITGLRDCAAAEYVELQAIQESGSSADTYVTDNGVMFAATRLT